MSYDIKGKYALITGGATGIGLAYSEELLKHGLEVSVQIMKLFMKIYGGN